MSLKPELEISSATAQAIVDCVLPGHAVAELSRVHGGEIAAVYQLAFVGSQAPLILKVYPDSLLWKMQKEANVLPLVHDRLSVAVPRILRADDSKRLLGLSFVLMTKLEGSILGGLAQTLSSQQLASAYVRIGQVLREFHRIPMDAFGYIGPTGVWTEHGTNRAYLSFQFERKLKEFANRGGAPGVAQRVAECAAKRAYLLDECAHPVLCHNDLHAGNVLAEIADGAVRLTGVLDFEGALAGDPLMDVAKALYYLDDEARAALFEGYGDMGQRHWSEALDLYHLYFVLELWCWMAQIGNRQPLEKLALDLERCSTA